MELFSYHPAGVETINAFNERLRAFAFDNDVNGVTAGHLGGALVLSVVLVDDDIGAPLILQPFVVPIYATQLLTLESFLGGILEDLKKRDTPQQIYKPVELRTIMVENTKFHAEGGPIGYALFLITIGYDEDAMSGGADNG
jgi:hypothetical protein